MKHEEKQDVGKFHSMAQSIPLNEVVEPGWTVLTAAVTFGKIEYVRCALEAKAQVDYPLQNGSNAMSCCVYYGAGLEIAQMLLDARADLSMRTPQGYSLLQWTAIDNSKLPMYSSEGLPTYADEDKRIDMARWLLNKGPLNQLWTIPKFNVSNDNGDWEHVETKGTPLDSAIQCGFNKLALFLSQQLTASISLEDTWRRSLCHVLSNYITITPLVILIVNFL